ncbi:MAG TPA: UMP kinase, partial [Chromatiales bacterium]|nr:UMP kinase [Chromatiales bacterium]
MHVVLSIGGSTMSHDGKPDVPLLKKLAAVLKKSRNSFGIVTGGGHNARVYANAARELGANEFEADAVAILSTKKNAHIMVHALKGLAYQNVLDDFEEARAVAQDHKVVVMGGTIPGITTDTDSVLLAEALEAKRVVNVSNVEAIYDSDPRKNKSAKRFAKLTYEELNKLAAKSDMRKAGTHF